MSTEPQSVQGAPSIVLAGGGSAGHVSPLLAIARAIVRFQPDARILAAGTAEGLESRLVPAAGFELATIGRVPMPRRPDRSALGFPAGFRTAVRDAGAVLERAGADVLVGVGGYVCTPFYLAARKRGIPIVIHEANTKAGLANRLGARYASAVGTAFAETKIRHGRHVGMPMRPEIAGLDRTAARSAARQSLGLDAARPTLVATGGSLGAVRINDAVAGAVDALAAAGIQVLHITGRGKSVAGPGGTPLEAPGYRQVEYVDAMETVYAAADVLLCRAGAATVSELAAVGLPAVLVPLPVGNGEQARNAAPLVGAGGALLVRDADLDPEWIRGKLIPLLLDPPGLAAMGERSAGLGIRDADEQMATMVLKAAGQR